MPRGGADDACFLDGGGHDLILVRWAATVRVSMLRPASSATLSLVRVSAACALPQIRKRHESGGSRAAKGLISTYPPSWWVKPSVATRLLLPPEWRSSEDCVSRR